MRQQVVEFSAELTELSWNRTEIGRMLGVLPRTLRDWERRQRWESLRVLPLGRPAERSPLWQRQQVLTLLGEAGPGVSVPVLRQCFPGMARAELADISGRFRRLWRLQNPRVLSALEWTRPGSVWAMDFAQAPAAVDGVWPYLLAVRDLGSGQQLLWQPLKEATAEATAAQLGALFAEYGAPLLLKSDNGSAFYAALLQELLAGWGVIPLFSPPYWPQYNGAIEAAIGALKVRTERQALLHGRAGEWTWEDVEAARQEGNWMSRPWGENGLAPQQRWTERVRLAVEERSKFAARVARCRQEVREEWLRSVEGIGVGGEDESARERQAIQRALVEHGYLFITRRQIPPPIPRPEMTFIP